jgi:hypothetical protein
MIRMIILTALIGWGLAYSFEKEMDMQSEKNKQYVAERQMWADSARAAEMADQ